MIRAAAVAFALVATPAAAADQFDLVCKEQYRFRVGGKWQPAETRYHFDLAANKYCGGDCLETRALADVTEAKLVLRQRDRLPGSNDYENIWIDRRTGEVSGLVVIGRYPNSYFEERKGSCEPAEFTGFPVPAAKF